MYLSDLIHVGRGYVSQFSACFRIPSGAPDAVGGRALERGIAVMVGLVDLMDERRPLTRFPLPAGPVAGGQLA